MDALKKREAALRLLESKGISRSNYSPPAARALWRLGIDVPPPHFASFGVTTLLLGTYFAVAWGLIMWLVFWFRRGLPAEAGLLTAVCAGILFGLSMAGYYAYCRRKYGIPLWRDFNPSPNGT